MGLHYSNGRLLLKNTTNNEWYYISVSIGTDLLPHIKVDQTIAGDFSLSSYDEYAILRADSSVLYKLGLKTTVDGAITYLFEPAVLPVEKLPVLVFLKDQDTGILYTLTGAISVADGAIYPKLANISAINNTLLDRPFVCVTPATYTSNTCRHPASFIVQHQIIIPPVVPLPTPDEGGGILGESGESILGEGGEHIEGEDGVEPPELPAIEGEGGEQILGEGGEVIEGE
jgi:hypothetical protein